jgi:hypothetical protein
MSRRKREESDQGRNVIPKTDSNRRGKRGEKREREEAEEEEEGKAKKKSRIDEGSEGKSQGSESQSQSLRRTQTQTLDSSENNSELKGQTAQIHIAVKQNNVAALQDLVAEINDTSVEELSAILVSGVVNDRIDAIKFLMKNITDPQKFSEVLHADNDLAFRRATTLNRDWGAVSFFISLNANQKEYDDMICADRNLTCQWSAMFGYTDILKDLVRLTKDDQPKYDAMLNSGGDHNTPLKLAAGNNWVEAMEFIISLAPNERGKMFRIGILSAAANGAIQSVESLLKLKPTTKILEASGALQSAITGAHPRTFNLLFNYFPQQEQEGLAKRIEATKFDRPLPSFVTALRGNGFTICDIFTGVAAIIDLAQPFALNTAFDQLGMNRILPGGVQRLISEYLDKRFDQAKLTPVIQKCLEQVIKSGNLMQEGVLEKIMTDAPKQETKRRKQDDDGLTKDQRELAHIMAEAAGKKISPSGKPGKTKGRQVSGSSSSKESNFI